MTTKEIAQATGKPERTIRDWVKAVTAKSATITAKLATSSPAYPADYTLAEVCQIIEEGMGPEAANVYRTNAVHATMAQEPKAPRLTGALVTSLLRACEKGKLSDYQFQVMIGAPIVENVPTPSKQPLQIESSIGRINKVSYAVEMKIRAKEQAKKDAEKNTPKLFGEE